MPPDDFFTDTHPRALKVFLDLQRRKTPSEKLRQVFEMTDLILEAARAGERLRHPDADEHEISMRAAARRFDRETMIKVWGWDPREHE